MSNVQMLAIGGLMFGGFLFLVITVRAMNVKTTMDLFAWVQLIVALALIVVGLKYADLGWPS